MTVSYNYDVSRNSFTTSIKLLLRWRGSVWKSVWSELVIWLVLYYFVFFIYRSEWLIGKEGQRIFQQIHAHIKGRIEWIPLNFLLGFYVSMVVDRWRQIFNNLGFIENIAISIGCLFRNKEDDDRHSRRALVRWCCLSQVLVFRDISLKVRKRFPNMETMVKSGFMEEHERMLYEDVNCDFNKYWVPLNWAGALCMKSRETGRLNGDNYLQGVLQELKNFRTSLALLCNFDWVPVPLAYPQLVITAVRSYFILCLISRQHLFSENEIDTYVPFMTILQFIFYTGWLKIAESLLNPMGEDDDHFECNYLIDRNIAIGLSIVDDTFEKIPEIIPDQFLEMPHAMYTESTAPKDGDPYAAFTGSVAHIVLAREDENVDMVTVVPDAGGDDDPLVPPSRKTSFANRFGTTMKKKFSARRGSQFTARIVPTSVLAGGAGSGPSTPQRVRAAAVRRASACPQMAAWRMGIDLNDDESDNGSVYDLSFSASKDSNKFDKSALSGRFSIPMSNGDVESGQTATTENGRMTPKPSSARITDLARPPTICEEEEDHSSAEHSKTVTPARATPASTPTGVRRDRPSVIINEDATIGMKSATNTPPMTPKSILKNRGEGSVPSSRAPSEPSSRDPHLDPVKEETERELSVAEAVQRVLESKKLEEKKQEEETSSTKHVHIAEEEKEEEKPEKSKKKDKEEKGRSRRPSL